MEISEEKRLKQVVIEKFKNDQLKKTICKRFELIIRCLY